MNIKVAGALLGTAALVASGAVAASALDLNPSSGPARTASVQQDASQDALAAQPGVYPGTIPTTCNISETPQGGPNGTTVNSVWSVVVTSSNTKPPTGAYKFVLKRKTKPAATIYASNMQTGTHSDTLTTGKYVATVTYVPKKNSSYAGCEQSVNITIS